MRRREFIALIGSAGAALPFAALADQPERIRRVGILLPATACVPAGTGSVGLDYWPQPSDRHALGDIECRRHSCLALAKRASWSPRFQAGNLILEVGGRPVASAGDVRNALSEAKSQGKRQVLMRVKMGDATRFVVLPLGNA